MCDGRSNRTGTDGAKEIHDMIGGEREPSLQIDADRYDAWYDSPKGRALLASEVACLQPLLRQFPGPYLEVGVGTGRFAQALGIGHGVDPSAPALEKARQRDITVVLGVGVNLNFPRERMPETIRDRATSLLEAGGQGVSRENFLRRLIQDLDRCYGTLEDFGFAAIAPRWEAYFALRGRRVRVEMVDEVISGTATGIDGDGALLLEAEDGVLHRVLAGDVIPLGD